MIEVKRPKFHVLSNFSHSVNISNYVSKKKVNISKGAKITGTYVITYQPLK